MAEGGEKTEQPTPKKLRDARKKGQVCTSKDVVSTAILIVLFAVLGWMGVALCEDIETLLAFIGGMMDKDLDGAVIEAGTMTLMCIAKHSFIFVFVAAVIAIAANAAQVGMLFAFEALKPSLDKLNPIQGFKRIFAMKNLFEFLKNCAKVTFLGYLIYKIIVAAVPELLMMCYGTLQDVFPNLQVMLKRLASYTVLGYVVIAAVDRLFQKRNYMKQMMMTKEEVKREYKEQEGSQEIKQAQRQFRDELLNGPDPRPATREASVVVTNPTHLAIGIRYEPEEAPLPKIVVAGADNVAKIIRETALEEGIPIMENIPLARSLWRTGKVDDFIPLDLVEPVAEVLKWVKSLNDAKKEEAELDSVEL